MEFNIHIRENMRMVMVSWVIPCIILCCTFFSVHSALASVEKEFTEVFIEAEGNNKYEAKIKAHEAGMQRVMYMLADKIGISSDHLTKQPYRKLKNVFTPIMVNNELALVEKYSATVDYKYTLGRFYNALLEYGDSHVDDMFYEYLIIPTFKQSSFLNVWEEDKRWNDFWYESRKLLREHKLMLPHKSIGIKNKITSENLMSLTYDDFIETFKGKLFKGVIIVSAEFFTNRRTRESIMRVNTKVLTSDGAEPENFEKDYPLIELEDIPYTVDQVIDRVIDDFGNVRVHDFLQGPEEDEEEEEDEIQPIIINFDVYNAEDLEIVNEKLENVDVIEDFKVQHDYGNRYKILIYTRAKEFELAEGLYLNGLSFKIHGSLYNLIDVKKGG